MLPVSQKLTISFTREVLSILVTYLRKHPEILKETDVGKIKQKLFKRILGKDYDDIPSILPKLDTTISTSGKRTVGDLRIFEIDSSKQEYSDTLQMWEDMYDRVMNPKYKKNTRNFSRVITGNPVAKKQEPPIFIVPRIRGGPSYLQTPLEGVSNEDVQFCPISKGYPMQDVSSFTLGPVMDEGLCIVNAAFSKSITIAHIEGGGKVDYSRKNFWKRAKTPTRDISLVSDSIMKINDKKYNIHKWLADNEKLWLEEWQIWHQSIALCSDGDFHWTDKMDDTIAYRHKTRYLNFVQWKLECYIRPAYDLMVETEVYKFLDMVYTKKRIPLALVHPMGCKNETEIPITREFIVDMMLSPTEMTCLPYLVAGRLLHVAVPLAEM